jgi:hypothetical protein
VFSDDDNTGEVTKKIKRVASATAHAIESTVDGILAEVPQAVPSPSRVTNQIEIATSHLVSRARRASTSLQIHEVTSRVPLFREALSNIISVDGILSSAELLLLSGKLIPPTLPVPSLLSASENSYRSPFSRQSHRYT